MYDVYNHCLNKSEVILSLLDIDVSLKCLILFILMLSFHPLFHFCHISVRNSANHHQH